MMAAKRDRGGLVDRLPRLRGRLNANANLSRITWFRVGGPAEVMFRPADADDLAHLLAERPADVPVTVIGVGSNLLVRDGGVPGVVIRLGRAFATVERLDGPVIRVGAAALDLNVALTAWGEGIAGFEFLSGIPGTIGGALRMNAGAYGREMQDVVLGAVVLGASGDSQELSLADLGFAYRRSAVPADHIFVSATLRGEPGEPALIEARMNEIKAARASSQPIRIRTGGSTFANPPGRKAWQLIEEAGCRGLRRGGAAVSEKHCNFMLNTGAATAADIEALAEEVRRRVFAASGVRLEWEIRRIGVPAGSLSSVDAGRTRP